MHHKTKATFETQVNCDYLTNTLYEVHSNLSGYTPLPELIQRILKRNIESLENK